MVQLYGGIDILVNNAAIQIEVEYSVHDLPLSVWSKTLNLNITG
eukprot:CAMPEP_0116896444 /NCGR_PEP_ID=MMETSP0467-20121206/5689_1 /TAXON_ID=283647 /ORGANISM="Mesodinium pulex, Strain SPMC105" /LENGTH=43 /DNA_ID= /DNA_START= /DNA_END= /DNA_ORIENTATION=